jgi:hypothetical protein
MIIQLFFMLLLPLSAVFADIWDKEEGKAQNTLPSLRVVLPYAFDDSSATSLILQGGEDNFRVNGTIGAYFTDQQRIKASYDFMQERLAFRFATGKTHKWINQQAGGLQYDYLVDGCFVKAFTVSGFYSYAQSKSLADFQVAPGLVLERHIAGSNYWNINAGVTTSPWENGFLGLELNYGQLKYERKLYSDRKLSGWGGKIVFDQYFDDSVHVHAAGEWKRFSKFAEAKVSKTFCFECGALDVGVFASRLVGEHGLNNNTRYGIEILLGPQGVGAAQSYYTYDPCRCRTQCDLIGWISQAAVEMPAIYAIAEQRLSCTGAPTALTTSISVEFNGAEVTVSAASAFSGSDLFYSLSSNADVATIDSATGLITIPANYEGGSSFTVTASNGCGSASVTVNVIQEG